ncbi:methyl-accepting chemotaxis protein [Methylophaga sulfidovorans]|uniref:Methyl-accepting chemotaxis sensory transducer n=1 Tax=Methylophaga sulfidovorans TaxID=45496 RepID=A0A1I3WR51_9GAMM|nr:methyl-accepting chemotaxis protein [Methylophaga sulfidovorans]SFK10005.1 methyl-accepting chemotaxis sensory transducer [Methylophaga sulfidovorans]
MKKQFDKKHILAWLSSICFVAIAFWLVNVLAAFFVFLASALMFVLCRTIPSVVVDKSDGNKSLSSTEIDKLKSDVLHDVSQQIENIRAENQQVSTILTNAVQSLTDSFQGLSEQSDQETKMLLSLVDQRDDEQGLSEFIQETESVMNYLVQTLLKNSEGSNLVMSKLGEIKQRVDGVISLLDDVKDIASQTNLLALNAAIEAARAGDAGRGFAVVADEVRKLSQKSDDFSDEINKITMKVKATIDETGGIISELVSADTDLVMNSKSKVAQITSTMSLINNKTESVITGSSDISQQISSLVNQALTSLQFEDMCHQLNEHMDKRLNTVSDLIDVINEIPSSADDAADLGEYQQKFLQVKETIAQLHKKINETSHKSVTQKSVDAGDIELF